MKHFWFNEPKKLFLDIFTPETIWGQKLLYCSSNKDNNYKFLLSVKSYSGRGCIDCKHTFLQQLRTVLCAHTATRPSPDLTSKHTFGEFTSGSWGLGAACAESALRTVTTSRDIRLLWNVVLRESDIMDWSSYLRFFWIIFWCLSYDFKYYKVF